jgi:hypothetical protein
MAKTASSTENGILGTVHQTAAGLQRAGVIDKATMREFDALCMATSSNRQSELALTGQLLQVTAPR